MRKQVLSFICVISFLWGGGPGASAEEPLPLRLSLREAVQVALKQNPQVQMAMLDAAESEQDRVIARAALLPQASMRAFEHVQRINLEAFIGTRIPGQPQHAGPFTTFQAGPEVSFALFDLALWRRWQASRHGARAAGAQELSVREQVVLLVVSQYLNGMRAAANVRAAQVRVEVAQALYDQAVEFQKQGISTGLDTLRANVQLQNEKQRLITAQTQHKTVRYGLVRLLNLDPRQIIELTDELSFFVTPAVEADERLESAFANRPEMQALEARAQLTLAQKRGVSEARLPKVQVAGNWAYQGVSAATAIPSYRYQVNVELPLFTSGRLRAERLKADLELKKIAREREELRNQIAQEVKTAIAELQAAREEVNVANLGVELAREEVDQARERFAAGVANNIEVISAQNALSRANDNQIAALYRYNQARADLAQATGQVEKLYAQ